MVNGYRNQEECILVIGGDMQTFEWLIHKDADLKTTDKDSRSILHSAARYGLCLRLGGLEFFLFKLNYDFQL